MRNLIASLSSRDIQEARRYGVYGVITNPSTFASDSRAWRDSLAGALSEEPEVVHVQVTARDTSEMVSQARSFRELVGDRLVVKVPVGVAGLDAVQLLRDEGFRTNMTAVVSGPQAVLAAQAGADFVSIYVGRIDRTGQDGVNVLTEIKSYLSRSFPNVGVVAASIHNLRQFFACALAGSDYAAVEVEMLRAASTHHLTDVSIDDFDVAWSSVMSRE